jgi:hypothetical protein
VLVSHAHFRRVLPTSMTRIIRDSLPSIRRRSHKAAKDIIVG